MKTSLRLAIAALGLVIFTASTAVVQGQSYTNNYGIWDYTTTNGAVTITGYSGSGGVVTIPDTINDLPVTTIGDNAFLGCTSLTTITIPNSVTDIEDGYVGLGSLGWVFPHGAFLSCTSLTNIIMGNSVTNIGFLAFLDCTGLTSVTIPNSVTTIGASAFGGCGSLTSVTIPNSVTTIEGGAFSGCGLTNVTIPNSVTTIGAGAFGGSSLTAITVGLFNPAYSSLNGVLFNKSQTTLVEYPAGLAGAYTIPNSVTTIGVGAFSDCTSLTSVTIPNSVTDIGVEAFDWCTSLTNITIPNSVTNIGYRAFQACSSLTSIYFKGNAPSGDSSVFSADQNATVYYLPGTLGWGPTFSGVPTALWVLPYPVILTSTPSFGVQTNGFGFTISWATNVSVVVEASTTLANPVWTPVGTNTLTSGSSYFGDPQWKNYSGRFYRIRSP